MIKQNQKKGARGKQESGDSTYLQASVELRDTDRPYSYTQNDFDKLSRNNRDWNNQFRLSDCSVTKKQMR